jgi:hypothetical protein
MATANDARFNGRYGSRAGFFILHWGVPAIHERPQLGDDPLAVFQFKPRDERATWRYVTNGMSEHEQRSARGTLARTELYAATSAESPWAIDLLDALARYPGQHDAAFFELDTIEVGQPIDQKGSPYTSLLLVPPEPEDPGTLGAIDIPGCTVLVHRIVGIYESECDFAIENGSEQLWKRLLESGQSLLLDHIRPRLC